MAFWAPNDQRVGAVPHEEGDADALDAHAAWHPGKLVSAHVNLGREREAQRALHVHDEYEGEAKPYGPGRDLDASRGLPRTRHARMATWPRLVLSGALVLLSGAILGGGRKTEVEGTHCGLLPSWLKRRKA